MVFTTGIGGILNTARQGIFSQQASLQITAQNLANANTEGYSRQRVVLQASAFGDGVSVQTVQRLRTTFFDRQLLLGLTELGSLSRQSEALARIESQLDEIDGEGVTQRLQELFASFHDLTARPRGVAERETVRAKAELLAAALNSNDRRLEDVLRDSDDQVRQIILEINTLAVQISDLNKEFIALKAVDAGNEIADQRQLLIEKLSSLTEIQTFDDGSGALTVLVAGQFSLVEPGSANRLEAIPSSSAGGVGINFIVGNGVRLDVTSRITTGELGGVLAVREQIVGDLRESTDMFAATLMLEINRIHSGGIDLNGAAGGDFFSGLQVTSSSNQTNTGGARVTASAIADPALLTLNKYEIRFTDPNTFDIVNLDTGTTLAGNAYVSGAPIVFDGISLTISDSPTPPAAGDVFAANTFTGAARNIAVAPQILADINTIAAAQSVEPGDNRNALALANLEAQLVGPGNNTTLTQMYQSVLTDLGIQVSQANVNEERQQDLVDQTQNFILSTSGVSIDEESADLIRFQRAFEASARVISIVDELLRTIINILQ